MNKYCFVDETIVNKKDVIYSAVLTNIDSFKTYKKLQKIHWQNINKIKNTKIKNKAKSNELKASFFRAMEVTKKQIRDCIDKNEIKAHSYHKSSKFDNEINNRERALKQLIDKTSATYYYIDNYDNDPFKEKIRQHAKGTNKIILFTQSHDMEGIQIADVYLMLM